MAIEDVNIEEIVGPIREVLSEEDGKRSVLIHLLQKIEAEEGYLPADSLARLSELLGLPLSEIYGVASFYNQFNFKPRGKKVVKVCMGTACYVRGSENVLNRMKDEFGIQEGETTEDLLVTLETVGCVGCCGLAPVAAVNDEVAGGLISKKIGKFIGSLKS